MTSSTLPRPSAPSAGAANPVPAAVGGRIRSFGHWLVRGRSTNAVWERPALIGLLLVTAVAYLYNLTSSGYANEFYSAAVQAGSQNWEAFLFGSSDAGNSITVDKPPASLWVMAISVRLFGLSSMSILLPEVIMGVVTVALVYVIVRRHFSPGAALLAGGVLASTPVAALMFRFNNPDALLVLLMTASVYFTLRAIESGRVRWLLLAGAMIGFGFLTKQLQAFVILPPLALAYAWAGPVTFGKRLLHLLAAFGAVIVSAGWWVALVELVPASLRPYVGGSQNNDFLELTFGYNGFGRLTGAETGSVTGGAGTATTGGGQWGSTGITRLLDGEFGGQIAWLIPAALVLLVVSFFLLRRQKRTDARRAIFVMFGGWLVLTGLIFSFMSGIFHAYYTVALAPAIAGVVGAGAVMLWNTRRHLWARLLSAALVLGTGVWAFALLTRATDWLPWLKFVVLAAAIVGALLLAFRWRRRALRVTTVVVSLVAVLLAPTAYTLQTISTGHTGSIVTAGPTVASSTGFGGGGGFGRGGGAGGGGTPPGGIAGGPGTAGGLTPPVGAGQAGTGAAGGTAGGAAGGGTTAGGAGGAAAAGTRGGGMGGGGLLVGATVSAQVSALLSANASSYTWAAAAVGSQNAASYQLASQAAVMPLGGFNGSDPSPTLEQFQAYVASGQIHYFISSGNIGASNGGSSASSSIATWVVANYTATTVDGTTLYDLTTAAATS
ncbi:glycosyltransferase family 39 protein [Subtercola frigoramans]|uniref:4-amino-4-deoxy-L-arabinose transferase-like glycosyltransferase n=1 Tax=Subtercola frigoramans TaxID=120298 RepID=A0ABS2L0B2_9MICO|nr:glycosyltransferase family 39 protein [Subtercola frigoramans]MBM7470502.1 4-amino-4-deoxy-L-arabinose transferase-like glycosyltransferase [Subtercola frigoramans]